MNIDFDYNKTKLALLRTALILLGFGVCALALWQYFAYYPDVVRNEYKIVITVVSSLVAATIMGLSAKPFYRLISAVMGGIASEAVRLGGRGIAACALGFIAAGMFTYVFDVMIRPVDVWAVRLLADVLVYIVFAAICVFLFTRQTDAPAEFSFKSAPVGYLLSAECLNDERALTAVDTLINVKITDCAYKALLYYGFGAEEAARLGKMTGVGALAAVHCSDDFSSAEQYAEIERKTAEHKRLRLITPNARGDGEVELSSFSPPSEKTTARFEPHAEPESREGVILRDKADNDAVGGAIIIDK